MSEKKKILEERGEVSGPRDVKGQMGRSGEFRENLSKSLSLLRGFSKLTWEADSSNSMSFAPRDSRFSPAESRPRKWPFGKLAV